MNTVTGSIECIIGNESRGVAVEAATPETVPTIAAAVWNLRDVKATKTRDGAVATWTAKDAIGADALVVLWPEPPLPAPRPQPEESEG